MEGAPVQPGDDERPLPELVVHVGCGEPGGAGPDSQTRSPQVLGLHRQQPVNNLDDTASWRPGQTLGCQPAFVTLALHCAQSRYSDHW